MKDTFNTILSPSIETLFKDRNSKFYGYAYPISNENDVKTHLTNLRSKHHQARHWCYAWVIGERYDKHRFNDDGEPSNSAGAPIYGQLQSYNVTNILIVVVRYFGGTKLGVGGLINAYRTSAQQALNASKIVEQTINHKFKIVFEYPLLNKVMRIIKDQNLLIVAQVMELNCCYHLSVRLKDKDIALLSFKNLYGCTILDKE